MGVALAGRRHDGGLRAVHHGPQGEDHHLQEFPRRCAHDGFRDFQVGAFWGAGLLGFLVGLSLSRDVPAYRKRCTYIPTTFFGEAGVCFPQSDDNWRHVTLPACLSLSLSAWKEATQTASLSLVIYSRSMPIREFS